MMEIPAHKKGLFDNKISGVWFVKCRSWAFIQEG